MKNTASKNIASHVSSSALTGLLLVVLCSSFVFGQTELAEPPVAEAPETPADTANTESVPDTKNISGQEFIPAERLAKIFSGAQDPETTEDLRAIEAHVKELVKKTTPATVGLIIGEAAGSGVIITNDGYVLTAGHVSMKPNLNATIILPDGRPVKGKTLGINNSIDSGLIKITEKGNWPYLEMGTSSDLKKGQWIVALGHPGGYQPKRQPVLRLGRILSENSRVIRTDCVLIGGDSGGPLISMDGKVIGIHSRINEKVTSNYHVPVDSYGETWDRLVKGEIWGGGMTMGGVVKPWLGFSLEDDESLIVDKVDPDSPAEKAGLKIGDKFKMFGGRKVMSKASMQTIFFGLTPGQKIAITVQRGDEEVNLELTVGAKRR